MRPFIFLPSLSPVLYHVALSEGATSLSFRAIRESPEEIKQGQFLSRASEVTQLLQSVDKSQFIKGKANFPWVRVYSPTIMANFQWWPEVKEFSLSHNTVSKGESRLISTSDWQNMNARTSIDWGSSQRKLYRNESTERSTFSFLCYFSDLESIMTVQSYISSFLSHTNDQAAVCSLMNPQGEYISVIPHILSCMLWGKTICHIWLLVIGRQTGINGIDSSFIARAEGQGVWWEVNAFPFHC